jgi:hypothetical protein
MTDYVTTQDIVIPAGTVLMPPPRKSTRWHTDYEGIVGHGRDHCSHWTVNIEDALELGLIRKAE